MVAMLTTMVAVPGPTCYPEMMHQHHQFPQQHVQSMPPQNMQPQNMQQQNMQPSMQQQNMQQQNMQPQNMQQQNMQPQAVGLVNQPNCPQSVPCSSNGIGSNPPPAASSPNGIPCGGGGVVVNAMAPPPQVTPMHPHPPSPLLHHHQAPLNMPMNHSSTTLTNSTNIPVVSSTVDMSGGPPGGYNPNQPPPPYCSPEYYGGEYYPGPPTDYGGHMCAVHSVPTGKQIVFIRTMQTMYLQGILHIFLWYSCKIWLGDYIDLKVKMFFLLNTYLSIFYERVFMF